MSGEATATVQLRHIAGFFAVTLTAMGGYGERVGPHRRLAAWAERAGVYPCGNSVSLFFGTPSTTSSEPVRFSLCLPVSKPDAARARAVLSTGGGAQSGVPGGGLGVLEAGEVVEVREFPRILAAVAFYRGPAAGASTAYGLVSAWVREHPYLPTGAPRELHVAEPGVLDGDVVEIEVQQPVMPKPR